MTNQQQWMKDVLSLARLSFETGVKSMDTFHEQIEKALQMTMDLTAVPEEGRKAVSGWLENMKKGRKMYTDAVDEGLKKLEETLA